MHFRTHLITYLPLSLILMPSCSTTQQAESLTVHPRTKYISEVRSKKVLLTRGTTLSIGKAVNSTFYLESGSKITRFDHAPIAVSVFSSPSASIHLQKGQKVTHFTNIDNVNQHYKSAQAYENPHSYSSTNDSQNTLLGSVLENLLGSTLDYDSGDCDTGRKPSAEETQRIQSSLKSKL